MKRYLLTIVMLVLSSSLLQGAGYQNQEDEQGAIRESVESYVSAFNRADADAIALLWSPEAVYTHPVSGQQFVGREAIQQQFTDTFADAKEAKLKLAVTTNSIQFISPGVAIEQGTAVLTGMDPTPVESEYSAIYVKRDGKWLMDRLSEDVAFEPPSHHEQLKELDWLVGRWTDQDDQATVVTECNWTKNKNFLVRSFTVTIQDRIDMSGIQFIGWDPSSKQIRSWVFDSDGGFGQGTWERKGNRWYVKQKGVLYDGRDSSSVNVISYLDDNSCTLQSIHRMVDGELLPNIDEVVVNKE